jgi:mitochondrial fission protein ELM1
LNQPASSIATLHRSTPRVWLIIGDKLGDNAQVKMIADSLGLPYETRRLLPKKKYVLGKPRFRISLDHLDLNHSDSLKPPWPDLVITVGRRHAMAALWVKEQNPATRVVLLGRPRRWIERFDLIIALPQYQIPDLPNVMRLSLPLMRPDKDAINREADRWRTRFKALRKPIIAVLVGGPTRPYCFDSKVASQLVVQCKQMQDQYGGTLYFSTSRRTPAAIVATLADERPAHSVLHEWQKDASDNPYLALLGLADYFVVTGDSVSMMIEVADCGKPLAIFSLPSDWGGRMWQKFLLRLHDSQRHGLCGSVCRWLGKRLYSSGIAGFGRDLGALRNRLIADGFAVAAGQPFVQPVKSLPNELERINDRIWRLLGASAG